MTSCDCLAPPPSFSAVPPPPDPSLVWHLLGDEPFEKAPDCEWSPFVSISDISSKGYSLTSRELVLTTLAAVLLLLMLVLTLIFRLRSRSVASNKSKTSSSDAIMACGDNVWTYNSMKNSQTGVMIYNGDSHTASRVFSHATPCTMRSYIGASVEPSLRPSPSTTLRLHPNERLAAYHCVTQAGGQTVQRLTNNEYYEEIPERGTLPPSFHIPPPPCTPPMHTNGRQSLRKPPPSCRPPPPPSTMVEYSPGGSDASIEHELQRIPSTSPPCPKWTEEGRESGYGTAPSRQWRSPPGSSGRSEDRLPTYVLPPTGPNSQNMTYV